MFPSPTRYAYPLCSDGSACLEPLPSAFTFHYTSLFQDCRDNYWRSNYIMRLTVRIAITQLDDDAMRDATLMTALACGLACLP
jgi:hypothetical protein